MPTNQFQLVYEGAGADGVIDARNFAESLDGLSVLVEECQSTSQLKDPIRACVSSKFEKGSFISTIELWIQNSVNLLRSEPVSAIANLCGILGLSGIGVLQLIKKSRGRKPKGVVEISETRSVKIEYTGEDPIEVPKQAWEIFNRKQVRVASKKMVNPMTRPGLDSMTIRSNWGKDLSIDKSEARDIISSESDEDRNVQEVDHLFKIDSISFKPGNKWKVSDGSKTYSVSIQDAEFLERVNKRREVFSKGDVIRALLRITQWTEGGRLKSIHEIVKVYSHLSPDGKQLRFLEE